MKKRLAIIGGGPLGLEAALKGIELGWDVNVFEKNKVGSNILLWGHVRMFSPLKDSISPLALKKLGLKADLDSYLTGKEFVETILRPLAETPELKIAVEENVEVILVAKQDRAQAKSPFHLLVKKFGEEMIVEADVVMDATGVYTQPNWAGESGIPCVGEIFNHEKIIRHSPNILGRERNLFREKRILVLGAGHSAATAIYNLSKMASADTPTQVHWVVRSDKARPCTEIANDPYPERALILKTANNFAETLPVRWNLHKKSSILNIFRKRDGSYAVTVGTAKESNEIIIDQIIALTGYRPDLTALEEIECEITAKKLESKEKNFFIIGHKACGRSGDFLIQSGLKQLDLIFKSIV